MAVKTSKQKISIIGPHGVGKTSLLRRFIDGAFEQSYRSTLGVDIKEKNVQIRDGDATLIDTKLVLWDVSGSNQFSSLEKQYILGSHACLVICDGTRPETLTQCLDIQEKLTGLLGDVPMRVLINKYDLQTKWCLELSNDARLSAMRCPYHYTSAQSGKNVDATFIGIAQDAIARTSGQQPSHTVSNHQSA